MRCTIAHNTLLGAIRAIAGLLPTKPTWPIHASVRLTADGETLDVAGVTDRVTARTICPARVDEPGTLVVNAHRLADYLAELSDNPLDLAAQGIALVVTAHRQRATFAGLLAEDFRWPAATPAPTLTVDPGAFFPALQSIARIAATGSERPALTGVYWEVAESLTLVATDSYVLALDSLPASVTGDPATALVAARELVAVSRVLDPEGDPVEVGFGGGVCLLRQGAWTVTAPLLDLRFPPYRHLIPAESDGRVVVESRALSDAIRAAGALGDKDGPVRLIPRVDGLAVRVGGDWDAAEAVVESTVIGRPPSAAFGQARLRRCLQDRRGALTLHLDRVGPTIIRSAEGGDWLRLIMPLNTQVEAPEWPAEASAPAAD